MKKLIVLIVLGIALLALNGCIFTPIESTDQLVLSLTPGSGYAPQEISLRASGVSGGEFTLSFAGTDTINKTGLFTIIATEDNCTGTVTWRSDGGETQSADFFVKIKDAFAITGNIVLNGDAHLWGLHPRSRYVVSVPDLAPGWHIADVHVQVARKNVEDTVYCPPYAGPGVYHAASPVNNTLMNDAFVFHSTWNGNIDEAVNVYPPWGENHVYVKGDCVNWEDKAYRCRKDDTVGTKPNKKSAWEEIGDIHYGTGLPYSPPGYGESGYPGHGINCEPGWDKHSYPASITTITITFRNTDCESLTSSWDIPTMPDPGCNTY